MSWSGTPKQDMTWLKKKTRCGVSGVVEGGHSFCPFGEVIDCDNNVFVTIAGGGICHKPTTT
jgi:hypothetical protein